MFGISFEAYRINISFTGAEQPLSVLQYVIASIYNTEVNKIITLLKPWICELFIVGMISLNAYNILKVIMCLVVPFNCLILDPFCETIRREFFYVLFFFRKIQYFFIFKLIK